MRRQVVSCQYVSQRSRDPASTTSIQCISKLRRIRSERSEKRGEINGLKNGQLTTATIAGRPGLEAGQRLLAWWASLSPFLQGIDAPHTGTRAAHLDPAGRVFRSSQAVEQAFGLNTRSRQQALFSCGQKPQKALQNAPIYKATIEAESYA